MKLLERDACAVQVLEEFVDKEGFQRAGQGQAAGPPHREGHGAAGQCASYSHLGARISCREGGIFELFFPPGVPDV